MLSPVSRLEQFFYFFLGEGSVGLERGGGGGAPTQVLKVNIVNLWCITIRAWMHGSVAVLFGI